MIVLGAPTVGDVTALARLKAETFIESFSDGNDPAQLAAHVARNFAEDVIAEELADPRVVTSWVVDDGDPVGYVRLNFDDAQTVDGLAEGAEIEQIYVRASHHGRGIGGQLLRHAVAVAGEWNRPFVWLGVWEHNAKAIAVYERHGFAVFGDHVFLFGDEAQRDLLMRLDLDRSASILAESPARSRQ